MTNKVLGAEHPSTLTSMASLAFTWKSHGRDAEALKLKDECVRHWTQVLDVNQPDTVSSTALSQWKAEELDISTLSVSE